MINEIGKRIKNLRKDLNITQEELARMTGFETKGAISKIENGHRDINQSQIVKFANALQTTPSYLMGWEEEPAKASNIFEIPTIQVPLIGSIAAGQPVDDGDNVLELKGDQLLDGIHNVELIGGDDFYRLMQYHIFVSSPCDC